MLGERVRAAEVTMPSRYPGGLRQSSPPSGSPIPALSPP